MSAVAATSRNEESTLSELIRRFPLAVALVGSDGRVVQSNARFESAACTREGMELFAPLLREPDGVWHSIPLFGGDGRPVVHQAQSVRVRDFTLLVIDDAGESVDMPGLDALRARIADLELQSATDSLTGAWNRLHLDRVIEHEINRSQRFRQPISLVLLDVDHFKRVNDQFGHLAGDEVLRQLVAVIRGAVRSGDLLFRWGGEEFVVLAASNGHRNATMLAEKLRERVNRHDFGTVGLVTVSVGVAEYITSESGKEWFARVDTALYAAKSGGRNRVVVDPRGSSDAWAQESGPGALRLEWSEAYECGEPTIDGQHRELFDLANLLIASALGRDTGVQPLPVALDNLLAHVAKHFTDEEGLLASHGYAELEAHRNAHRALLARAADLKAGADAGTVRVGDLVEFLAGDVVSRHLLKADRAFFHLFRGNTRPVTDEVVLHGAHSHAEGVRRLPERDTRPD